MTKTTRTEGVDAADAGELKVFISYSRTEVAFADELELFLRNSGFEPLLDRHGIDAGEDWKKRLGDLILSSDTVVFVLSDTSAQSPVCTWEVEEAERLSKRMLVVTLGPTSPGVTPPPQLSGINWISCWPNPAIPGSSQTRGFFNLSDALRTDLGWLRAQTVLQEQAARWQARGGLSGRGDYDAAASSMLLRGNVLAEALEWAQRAPRDVAPPPDVAAFLSASETHEAKLKAEAEAGLKEKEEALARAVTASARVRRASLIGAGVAALFLVVAAVAFGFALRGFNLARDANEEVENRDAAIVEAQSNKLATESKRIFDETGPSNKSIALLMALQATPSTIHMDSKITVSNGHQFPLARSRLVAAYTFNELKLTLSGAKSPIQSVDISPDGRYIATGSGPDTFTRLRGLDDDYSVRLWDASTGAIARTLIGHENTVNSVAFSPDGALLASASEDESVRIWDATTGEVTSVLSGHISGVSAVAFSPNGDNIVATTRDPPIGSNPSPALNSCFWNSACLWDISSGTLLLELLDHKGPVTSAAFFPNGTKLVTGSADHTAIVWDLKEGYSLFTLKGHTQEVTSVALSPDGRYIITGSLDGTVRTWNASTGVEIGTPIEIRSPVTSVAFLANSEFILIGLDEGYSAIWSVREESAVSLYGDGNTRVTSVAASSDGEWFVAGRQDNSAQLWYADLNEPSRVLGETDKEITSVAVSPNGTWIISGSDDNTAQIWNATTGSLTFRLEGHTESVTSVASSPDGQLAVTGSDDRTARLWNADTGLFVRALEGHGDDITSVSFSHDGKWIATGSEDYSVAIWSVDTGKMVRTLDGTRSGVRSVAFSTDDRRVLAGYWDGTAVEWDMLTGQILRTLQGSSEPVTSVAYSGVGGLIATGSSDNTVRLWDSNSGAPVRVFDARARVNSVGFSPNGELVVTGSDRGSVLLWDANTGEPVWQRIEDAGDMVSVAFSSDGSKFLAGSSDAGILIWEVPPILLADAPTQVNMACQMLASARTPLAFSVADIARYPVLQGQPVDPDDPTMLASPCRGVLPDEVFAK